MKFGFMIESFKIENHYKPKNLEEFKMFCDVNLTSHDDFSCNKNDIPLKLLHINDLIDRFIKYDIDRGAVRAFYTEDQNGDVDILGYELL